MQKHSLHCFKLKEIILHALEGLILIKALQTGFIGQDSSYLTNQ